MVWSGSLFDPSTFLKEENPLDAYDKGASVKMTIIPIFEILYNDDSGFGIYSVEDTEDGTFSIQGNLIAPLIVGQTYLANGYVTEYRGEKQLKIISVHNVKPVNKKGIVAYLMTLKGLKSKAELIYDVFGDESIDVLMNNPMRVAQEVRGIGEKSVRDWAEQLDKMRDIQYVLSSLLAYGLTPTQAKKLHSKFGDEIVAKITDNPYMLSKEVSGYGFQRCDRIARTMGFDLRSSFRLQEGIIYTLEQESKMNAHCYVELQDLINKSKEMLDVHLSIGEMNQYLQENRGADEITHLIGEEIIRIPYQQLRFAYDSYQRERNNYKKKKHLYPVVTMTEDEIGEAIKELATERRIVYEDGNLYLYELYEAEEIVSARAKSISTSMIPYAKPMDMELELKAYLNEKGYVLEDKQHQAVIDFSETKGGFYILNGSAGCGKTFTLKIILEMLERRYKNELLKCKIGVFAPTGKASKVASRSTGRECLTIHRGLRYMPGMGFEFNEHNPLELDVLVVDESSFLDILLMKDLLLAVKNGTKVILMGDTKQLPSVGAGNVLRDLIASNVVHIVTLDVIKRQGLESGIVINANKIINQEKITTVEETKDAFVVPRNTGDGALKAVVESYARILNFPNYKHEDIQVLAPQRTGVVGTHMLNYTLQQAFNPYQEGDMKVLNHEFDVTVNQQLGSQRIELYFQKGDKVIHTSNDYDKEWFDKTDGGSYIKDPHIIGITNGECGIIEDILTVKEGNLSITRIIVKFEGKFVQYDNEFQSLDHAWALTIHKSQGSQWKAVIMPIMMAHRYMLDNNLFYTGYTRAELFNCVIGQEEAILTAINTFKNITRNTSLEKRLLVA